MVKKKIRHLDRPVSYASKKDNENMKQHEICIKIHKIEQFCVGSFSATFSRENGAVLRLTQNCYKNPGK